LLAQNYERSGLAGVLIVAYSTDARLLLHHMFKSAGYRLLLSVSSVCDVFKQLGLDHVGTRGAKVDQS